MSNIDTSYRNADSFGRPAFEVLDTYIQTHLMAGAEPAMTPATPILLDSSLTLAQFTVVGLSAADKLTPAIYDTDSDYIEPIGVLAHAASSGVSNTTKYGQVWLTGNFNAGSDSPLVWDASWDTEAKKVGATKANSNLRFTRRAIA